MISHPLPVCPQFSHSRCSNNTSPTLYGIFWAGMRVKPHTLHFMVVFPAIRPSHLAQWAIPNYVPGTGQWCRPCRVIRSRQRSSRRCISRTSRMNYGNPCTAGHHTTNRQQHSVRNCRFHTPTRITTGLSDRDIKRVLIAPLQILPPFHTLVQQACWTRHQPSTRQAARMIPSCQNSCCVGAGDAGVIRNRNDWHA